MSNFEKFVITLAFGVGFGLLFTYPIMWLINYIFTPYALLALFGAAKITFWKTFALSVLSSFLTRRSK